MSDIQPIDANLLETLRKIPSCSIANAIETFSVQPRNVGFMGPEVKSIFPNMGHMIGYAVTAKIAADAPPSSHMNVSRTEWVDSIMKVPAPRVLVLEDIDYPNPIGSFWGKLRLICTGRWARSALSLMAASATSTRCRKSASSLSPPVFWSLTHTSTSPI